MNTKRCLEQGCVDRDRSAKKSKIIVATEIGVLDQNNQDNECDRLDSADEQAVLGQEWTSDCESIKSSAVVHKVSSIPTEDNSEDKSVDAPPNTQKEGVRISMNKIVDETLTSFKANNDLLKQLKSIDKIMKMLSGLFKSNKSIELNTMDEVKALAAAIIQLNDKTRHIDSLLIQLTDEIRATKTQILSLIKQLQHPDQPKTAELQQLILDCQKKSATRLEDSFKLVKASLVSNLLKTDTLAAVDGKTIGFLFDLLILHLSTTFLLSTDSDKPQQVEMN